MLRPGDEIPIGRATASEPELPRCRRSARRAGNCCVVRDDSALWCEKFGPGYARRLKRRQGRLGDVIDVLVHRVVTNALPRDSSAGLLHGQGKEPFRIITDRLKSYSAAMRTTLSNVAHRINRYANNRAEISHQPTRQRERQMRRFKPAGQAHRFLSLHRVVQNLFRVGSCDSYPSRNGERPPQPKAIPDQRQLFVPKCFLAAQVDNALVGARSISRQSTRAWSFGEIAANWPIT